jgi:protein associated with RNAse G/E
MRIIRGDSKTITFQRKNKNGEVIAEKPDKMYLTIKQNEYEKQALIQKTFDNGIRFENSTYYVDFVPEDTDNLSFGDYIYDIEIIKDGKPKTIKVDEFVINKEVTHKENEV